MELTFPNIDPVAFSLGPLLVRWYALAYLAGFLLGWQYCLKIARWDKNTRPNAQDIEDFLPWAILGVIFGGRAGYVLFYNFKSRILKDAKGENTRTTNLCIEKRAFFDVIFVL